MKVGERMGSPLLLISMESMCLRILLPVVNVQALHCVDAIVADDDVESNSISFGSKEQLRCGLLKHKT